MDSAESSPEREASHVERFRVMRYHVRMSQRPTFDPDRLYVALDRQRRDRRISWRKVAAEAGVSPSGLTRLSRDGTPDVPGLLALMAWLDVWDVRAFISEEDPK